MIVTFTPENTTNMRSLCKEWTEGSPAAFAVLDGEGTWSGTNQLCITQEGQTPFIGQWTTVSNWTTDGSPYLWWTGPADTAILQAVVDWGLSTGLLGGNRKVGVIAGTRASDQLALNQYLLPDLRRAGVTATVETIAASPTESATTSTEAPLVIQKLKAAGVDSVIPLIPFNAFFPLLQAETAQNYFPKLLLSDYESSIEAALGLLPDPYEKALNGQEGVTTETLGGIDDTRPESEGGYDPSVRSCFATWHKAYPQIPPGDQSFYIEEQGPVQGWCQEIRLFATAAKAAGRDLNRRTFVEAMSKIRDYPGGYSPVLQLRAGQVLRPDRVPGGGAAQQHTAFERLQNAEEPHRPGALLGGDDRLAPAAHRPMKADDVQALKDRWERTGWVVAERVIPEAHLEAAQRVLGRYFPTAEEFAADHDPERNRALRAESTRCPTAIPSRAASSTAWCCTTPWSPWPRPCWAPPTSGSTKGCSRPSTPTGRPTTTNSCTPTTATTRWSCPAMTSATNSWRCSSI